MPDTNATILIPDISGFTEFMTSTELEHGSHAISFLLDAIIQAVGDEYEISEIEGDAVLMFKRGPAPTKKEILDICLKIFNAFHYQRKWMQQHTICPCGACQAIINLTLKFIAHHGMIGEMRIGRFITLSGTDVIIAHRLLKNSVPSHEYLLLSEKLLNNVPDSSEDFEMEWNDLSDEFASIGKVNYHFARLEEARKKTPDPPMPETHYQTDNTSQLETTIAANFRDVYMILMNIPSRAKWVPGLLKVEQEFPNAFVGSIHYCTFEDYKTVISPLQMELHEEGIVYAESCKIEEMNLSLVYEFTIKKINENACIFASRFMNAGESPISAELNSMLFKNMQGIVEKLKSASEKLEKSFFK